MDKTSNVITFPTLSTPKSERRIRAFFPSLNKQDHLSDYRSQTDGAWMECEITKTLLLSDSEYRDFSTNLLSNDERIAGTGGNDTDAEGLDLANFYEMSEADQERAKAEVYTADAVLIVNRDTGEAFVVDAQGYSYARYVGLIDVNDDDMKEKAAAAEREALEARRQEVAKRKAAVEESRTHKAFEVGKTYYTRSACDHNCVFSFEVKSRTAKTVTLNKGYGNDYRKKIYTNDDGQEYTFPNGMHSMCPIIDASDFLVKG